MQYLPSLWNTSRWGDANKTEIAAGEGRARNQRRGGSGQGWEGAWWPRRPGQPQNGGRTQPLRMGRCRRDFRVHQHTQDQALRPGWAGGRGKERERLRGRRQAGQGRGGRQWQPHVRMQWDTVLQGRSARRSAAARRAPTAASANADRLWRQLTPRRRSQKPRRRGIGLRGRACCGCCEGCWAASPPQPPVAAAAGRWPAGQHPPPPSRSGALPRC